MEGTEKMNVQQSPVADDPQPAVQVKSNNGTDQSTRDMTHVQDCLCTAHYGEAG